QSWQIHLSAAANDSHPAVLPPLERGQVTIDGSTQPGAGKAPRIILDGDDVYEPAGLNVGFTIKSSNNTLRALALINFYDTGIVLDGIDTSANQIEGIMLGISPRGAASLPSGVGIEVRSGASSNLIGGPDAAQRNVIVGAVNAGIHLTGNGTSANQVLNNWIGLAPDSNVVKNTTGITISNNASENQIGAVNGGNLIGGNENGIYLDHTFENKLIGNLIGFSADGSTPRGNQNGGVYLVNGAHDNQIGGTASGERNVIGNNGAQGVYLAGAGTSNNTLVGNFIGISANGIATAGNLRQGVLVGYDATQNQIGGSADGAGNVIVYNGLGGIRLDSDKNVVAGNLIGVGANGSTPLGNQNNGIRIGGQGNVIGPDNTIAYSQAVGLLVGGNATQVYHNRVLANEGSGVCILGAGTQVTDNDILDNGKGQAATPECAIQSGMYITGTATLIANNRIRGNQASGIAIYEGRGNTISANSISANKEEGIILRSGANEAIEPPALVLVEPNLVRGTACPGCRVEVFMDNANQGGSMLGATVAAPDGQFELVLTEQITNTNVTATHTDANGNTSQFAAARGVRATTRLYFQNLPQVVAPITADMGSTPVYQRPATRSIPHAD
ncbi:MAG TPA: right-handed parallel beta-helix repeat-containing protein, partial [Roseiflexaceae bacterium]|nr:right-handed parallel beta-helix repeat-containing protein [Roseiflexaceae bacterium]